MIGDDDLELDFDRFEYVKIETFGGDTYYQKVGCKHTRVEPVLTVAGKQVATLCLDCDEQLPVIRGGL